MNHLNRRELAALLAGGVALPGLAADEKDKKQLSPLDEQAEALFRLVKARHGKHLSDDQLQQVRAGIRAGLRAGESLHRVKLPASDEPAFVFQADLP